MLAGLVVVVAAGAACYFALGGRLGPRKEIAPPDDGARLRHTDPKLIAYEEIEGIPTGMNEPRGIAVNPYQDNIYVVGDLLVRVFDANGVKRLEFPTVGEGTSLAVGLTAHHATPQPREILVATKNTVEDYYADGGLLGIWQHFDPNSMFSSIATLEGDVFIADDNRAEVIRCDIGGNVIGRIGRQDPGGAILLRSPHFDVAVWPGNLLWITNPGRLRVEAYTFDGKQEVSWGDASMDIEGFSGCCNPKDIAFLPTGEVVTSEKGLPRVKVYTRDGKFLCVVAGPESFDPSVHYLDLAVDSKGRVLVLDPVQKKVRIFVKKKQT
jgi:DNA-binding beta-propeller fold protein YncE